MTDKKKSYKETSRVLRVSGSNYLEFKALKTQYAKDNNKAKVTFDEFLSALLSIAKLMQLGTSEIYAVGNKLFDSVAEARGQAIVDAVAEKAPPRMPRILLEVGHDDGLSR